MFDPLFADWNLPARGCDEADRPAAAAALLERQLVRLERLGFGHPFVLRPTDLGFSWFPANHWLVGCGNADLLRHPAVAVVGTRRPAPDEEAALGRWLDRELPRLGLTVVSGGARGIDTLAHQAALRAGLPTVAVLAGGLLHAGPAQNRGLFRDIVAAGGCLLSEQPLGARPFDTQFVARNRTIAALALGTLVVRAPVQSGALTTAGFAKRMNHPVAVLPGQPWEPSAAGSNALLECGARAVADADGLAALLGVSVAQGPQPLPLSDGALAHANADEPVLSEAAARLWKLLGPAFDEGDGLVARAGLSGGEALAALTELELDGLLERHGTQWRRARR